MEGGHLAGIEIVGHRSSLDRIEITTLETNTAQGTTVRIENCSSDAQIFADDIDSVRERLLEEFAIVLLKHPDFKITVSGVALDPATAMDTNELLDVETPEGVSGGIQLRVITWTFERVAKSLFLGRSDGVIVTERQAGIRAPGVDFTAYLIWEGFDQDYAASLQFEDDE